MTKPNTTLEMDGDSHSQAPAVDVRGALVRLLKAVELRRSSTIHCLMKRHPSIMGRLHADRVCRAETNEVSLLRAMIVSAAKKEVEADLRELGEDKDQEETVRTRRRESIARKIRKLKPGCTDAVTALAGEDGQVTTDMGGDRYHVGRPLG